MKQQTEVSQNIPWLTPEAQTILIRAAELMALINSTSGEVLEALRAHGVTQSLLTQSTEKLQGEKRTGKS